MQACRYLLYCILFIKKMSASSTICLLVAVWATVRVVQVTVLTGCLFFYNLSFLLLSWYKRLSYIINIRVVNALYGGCVCCSPAYFLSETRQRVCNLYLEVCFRWCHTNSIRAVSLAECMPSVMALYLHSKLCKPQEKYIDTNPDWRSSIITRMSLLPRNWQPSTVLFKS